MKDTGIQFNDTSEAGAILDLKIRPVRNADGKIISGLVIGNTLEQNKALILIAQEGQLKFNPDLGVGLPDNLYSTEYLRYRHKIREHFDKDGLTIENLDLYENRPFKIEANYE